MLRYEQELVAAGHVTLAGIDEAGRGPLAGPVVAAAVILPWSQPILGVRDSKTVRPRERERLYYEIVGRASAIGLGVVDVGDIDRINIFRATVKAMEQAVICLNTQPDAVLVDAMTLPGVTVPQRAIVHGDATSYLIAAASIVAKVARDCFMTDYDARYPQYQFAVHKGYGTQRHLERLARLGPCRIHRRTFRPVLQEAAGDGQ